VSSIDSVVIAADDPLAHDVAALLATHLAFARAVTAADDVHALPTDELAGADVAFFSARVDGAVVGIGALKHLDGDHVEIKSMHTAASARGRGVGRAMVQHLVDTAREHGCRRVSLETGSMTAFAPARALYAAAGFEECDSFGDYGASPERVCMTLVLSTSPT